VQAPKEVKHENLARNLGRPAADRLLSQRCSRNSFSFLSGFAAQSLDEAAGADPHPPRKRKQENAERERRFQTSRDQQAALLNQAEAQRKAAEALSHQLSAQYDANDKEINNMDTLLKQRAGNLGELFGVTRQVAGDTATVLSQSILARNSPIVRTSSARSPRPGNCRRARIWSGSGSRCSVR